MLRQIQPRSCREINELAPAITGWDVFQNGRLIMNDSNPSSPIARPRRPAWNKGKLAGPKPPLRPGHVWSIRARLQLERHARDLALFNLAIDSKLRGCDLVALGVDDIAPMSTRSIGQWSGRGKRVGLFGSS
jgi:hypothetical protein